MFKNDGFARDKDNLDVVTYQTARYCKQSALARVEVWCTRLNRDMVREKLSDEEMDATILQAAQKLGSLVQPVTSQEQSERSFEVNTLLRHF